MAAIIVCSINNTAFIKQDRDGIINKKEKSLRLEQNLLLQKNNFQSNNWGKVRFSWFKNS